jgi:hypothetical protein
MKGSPKALAVLSFPSPMPDTNYLSNIENRGKQAAMAVKIGIVAGLALSIRVAVRMLFYFLSSMSRVWMALFFIRNKATEGG